MKNLYKLFVFLFFTSICVSPLLAGGQKAAELDYNELESIAELKTRAARENIVLKNTPYNWQNVMICSYPECIAGSITPVFDIILKQKPEESGLVFVKEFYVPSFRTSLIDGERFKATRQGKENPPQVVVKTIGQSNFGGTESPPLKNFTLGALYLIRVEFTAFSSADFQETNKPGFFFKGTIDFTYNDLEDLKTINYSRAIQKALLLILNIDNPIQDLTSFQGDVYTFKFQAVASQGNTISVDCLFYIILD